MSRINGEDLSILIGVVVGFLCVTAILLGILGYAIKSNERDSEERIHLIDACAVAEDPATCILVGGS